MKICVNGQQIETQCTSVYQLSEVLNFNREISTLILNGFQLSEDRNLKEDDKVFIIDKTKMPTKEELSDMLYARHTPQVHKKIEQARVAIAGLGGLGSNIAINLARTGIGFLHLIDFDTVEPSNLNRQQYRICHLGLAKTEALKMEIAEINPFVEVITDNVKIDENNINNLFKDDNFICEAFDNPECKAILVNNILENYKDKKIVASSGMAGFESSNTITTKKISNNLYLCGDGETDAKEGRGLMSPRVSICAGHQSNMILRLILGLDEV